MKRVLLCIVFLLILSVTTTSLASTYYVSTDIDALNVHDAADRSIYYGIIRAGNSVNVDYIKGDWAYLKFKGHDACVYKYYLVGDLTGTESGGNGKSTSGKKTVSTDEASMIYIVKDSVKTYINARATKSDNGTILGKLYPGDEVYVVKVGGTWARIIYKGGYAFVKSKYIQKCGYNLPEEGLLYRVSVKEGTTLNVRRGPGVKKKIITTLSNGAFVKVLEEDGKWSYIYYSIDDLGYVMSKFLIPVNK